MIISDKILCITLIRPTCVQDGYKKNICAVCGAVQKNEVIKATGHQWQQETKAPTCTEDGYEKTACITCGKVDQSVKIPRAFHKMIIKSISATCTEEGQHHKLCEKCGHDYGTEIIPARGHYMMPERVAKNASCTGTGLAVKSCQRCSYEVTRVLPQLEHVEDGSLHLRPAKCNEAGYRRKICRSCAVVMEEIILPPTGHDYYWQAIVNFGNGDCRNTGYDREVCRNCHDVKLHYKTGKHVPVTETIKPADSAGLIQRTYCQLCGTTLSEVPVP